MSSKKTLVENWSAVGFDTRTKQTIQEINLVYTKSIDLARDWYSVQELAARAEGKDYRKEHNRIWLEYIGLCELARLERQKQLEEIGVVYRYE